MLVIDSVMLVVAPGVGIGVVGMVSAAGGRIGSKDGMDGPRGGSEIGVGGV